jgi:hypothetical protein
MQGGLRSTRLGFGLSIGQRNGQPVHWYGADPPLIALVLDQYIGTVPTPPCSPSTTNQLDIGLRLGERNGQPMRWRGDCFGETVVALGLDFTSAAGLKLACM